MGGRAPGMPPLDLPRKTRMPGKWGGRAPGAPPLDPPMKIASMHSKFDINKLLI